MRISQYRTREPMRSIGNTRLHDYYSVRGSVFDRALQTSPAKAAAGDALASLWL